MSKRIFEPGDVIRLENKEYIVIQNYGSNGMVKEHNKDGIIIKGFSWVQNDKRCEYIKKSDNEQEIVNIAKKEYEEFFEKYELK